MHFTSARLAEILGAFPRCKILVIGDLMLDEFLVSPWCLAIEWPERVAGWLIRGLRSVDFDAMAVWLNGSPAIRLDIDGHVDTAVSLTVEDGRITRVYAVRNPQKLTGLRGVATLSRT